MVRHIVLQQLAKTNDCEHEGIPQAGSGTTGKHGTGIYKKSALFRISMDYC